MSLSNPDSLVTEERLQEFYQGLLPYLGGMPEFVANKFSKADLYDTTEKVVGKWIDGRPLYQKTVSGTLATSSADGTRSPNIEINLASINTITVVNIKQCYVQIASSAQGFIPQFGYAGSSTSPYVGLYMFVSTGTDTTKQTLFISHDKSSYSEKTIYVTVQYTKTSDAANSFKYANETDYSTTEKIVGTWIDGKPVYQKTIVQQLTQNGSSNSPVSANYNHNIANVDKIWINEGASFLQWATHGFSPVSAVNIAANSVSITCNSVNDTIFNVTTGGYDRSSEYIYLTLQYTKTTDTPNT